MKTLMPAFRTLRLASLAVLIGLPSSRAAGQSDPILFKTSVDAAAETVPALQYTLLYERVDQVPGNAALAYQRVARLLATSQEWKDHQDRCREWLDAPLAEFPIEDARKLLVQQRGNLEQLAKATRYEDCDWGIPVRQEGVNALLPHLSEMREAARLLALEIRVLVRQGDYESALDRLRAGMTLAQHVGGGDLLIEGLVGLAIANLMLDRAEELIGQPGAPNLYWALTDLPPGYLSAWQATRWERSFLYVHLPVLWEARSQTVTADALRRAIGQFQQLSGQGRPLPWLPDADAEAVASAGLGLVVYPIARRELAAQGTPERDVETMSVSQVLVTYFGSNYAVQRDNLFKWFNLPYAVARPGLQEAQRDLEAAMVRDPIGSLLPRLLLPALSQARQRFVELERRLALLRCVEAIRAYAAARANQLPRSLGDITELPVPPDPVTAAAFGYRMAGGTAVLEAGGEADPPRLRPRTYELTLRP